MSSKLARFLSLLLALALFGIFGFCHQFCLRSAQPPRASATCPSDVKSKRQSVIFLGLSVFGATAFEDRDNEIFLGLSVFGTMALVDRDNEIKGVKAHLQTGVGVFLTFYYAEVNSS